MRFAFSNIAWSPHDSPGVFALMREHGITGIEVAPTKLWPQWADATDEAVRSARDRLQAEGFVVPSMQALLFGTQGLHVFDETTHDKLIAHLTHVARIGQEFGARAAVFGSPKQRTRGARTHAEAIDLAAPLFRRLAQVFFDHGVCLCIEPNPRRYGCDFVINAREGIELVKAVDHPGFQLHLDAAGMALEGDSLEDLWPEVAPMLRHFHISETDLGDFRESTVPHTANLQTLRQGGYAGWCSVEMREPSVPLEEAGPWRFIKEEKT